jgi:hypothetical protein
MSTTIPVSRCTVKPRSACKLHGAVDHKRFDVELAENEYNQAKQDYANADPATRDQPADRWSSNSPLKKRLNTTRVKYNRLQSELDAMPSEYRALKKAATQAHAQLAVNRGELHSRLRRAENLINKRKQEEAAKKAEAKRLAVEKKANQTEFDKIKQEVANQQPANLPVDQQWKIGYQKAIAAVVAEQGKIVDGNGYSSYGIYMPATNHEKTAHFRQCGALDIRNVEEEAWDEWDFNSMSSVQTSHQEYAVRGEATCNCGQLVKEKIEVNDSFSNIVSSVLKF